MNQAPLQTDLYSKLEYLVGYIRNRWCMPFIRAGVFCCHEGESHMNRPLNRATLNDLKNALIKNDTGGIEGGCTPFIGAGISGAVLEKLQTSHVVKYLADKRTVPAWVPRKLHVITEYLEIQMCQPGEDVAEYIKELTKAHKNRNKNGWKTLQQLAKLPFPLYITTNYDDLLEQALIDEGKTPRRVLSGWFLDPSVNIIKYLDDLNEKLRNDPVIKCDGVTFEQPSGDLRNAYDDEGKIKSPVVFHLHGHVAVPDSMVLTEEDYVDFLVAYSKSTGAKSAKALGNMPLVLPAYVEGAFERHTLLAIGYGLKDLNFQVLLRAIRKVKGANRVRTISIQMEPGASDCFQSILQTRISEALIAPHLNAADCLAKAQAKSGLFEVSDDETADCLTSQKEFLIAFFRDELAVQVCWCTAQELVDALYQAYP